MTEALNKTLSWNWGLLSVERLGGMLGPVLFILPDGRQVAPLQVAPWFAEPEGFAQDGLMRRLRGDWACVPFGFDVDRPALGDWPGTSVASAIDIGHGFGSGNEWTFGPASDGELSLSIDYPDAHPIARLERRVIPDPDAPAIDIELTIVARRDCAVPIGLHPTMRLPAAPQAATIEVEPGLTAVTLPRDADASSIFSPAAFASIDAAPLRGGGTLDARHVPLPLKTEDLLQILDIPGKAALWNRVEGYRVRLTWNAEHFPSLLLWFSNRGRDMSPWNGRHLALGMEPICSAFDLGTGMANADNPIARRGTPTARRFTAGERFVTRYRIEVEAAEQGA